MLNIILNLIKKIIPLKLFKILQPFYHYSLARLSAFIYNYPSNKIIVVGVTGTSGKSSTCYFIAQILENAGFNVGMTSTTLFKIKNKEWLNDKKMTMLGRLQTQKLLRQMVKEKCQVAIIETTSQGIEQFRHIGINYDILVFTNLYPEHIEAHEGFENYKFAKGKLFKYLEKCKHKEKKKLPACHWLRLQAMVGGEIEKLGKLIKKTIIVNSDDEYADYFLHFKADQKYAFGKKQETRNKKQIITNYLLAENIEKNDKGYIFKIQNTNFEIPLLGDYNIYNVLSAISVAKVLNVDWKKIKNIVANLKPLPGRLEFIENDLGIKIIVDYAFEPKALEKLYQTVKYIGYNKIIHILGSAGGSRDRATQRDKSRRPVLGEIAGQNADIVIVTNEDPYDEEPQEIISQIAEGVSRCQNIQCKNVVAYKILDRRQAIKKGLELSSKGDLLLITGKGAEQAICVKNGKKIPWDDRRVIRDEIKKIGF